MTSKFFTATKTYENWLQTHPFVSNEAIKAVITEFIFKKRNFFGEDSIEMAFRKNGEAVVCKIDFLVEEFRILLIRGHVIRFFSV